MTGEPEAATLNVPVTGELDTPYSYSDLLESALLVSGQEILRRAEADGLITPVLIELPTGGLIAGADYYELPIATDVVSIASISIDSKPGVEASVEGFYQRLKSTRSPVFAFVKASVASSGSIIFKGTMISVWAVKEKALADWTASDLLPDEYDEAHLFMAYERLMIGQGAPAFRL